MASGPNNSKIDLEFPTVLDYTKCLGQAGSPKRLCKTERKSKPISRGEGIPGEGAGRGDAPAPDQRFVSCMRDRSSISSSFSRRYD